MPCMRACVGALATMIHQKRREIRSTYDEDQTLSMALMEWGRRLTERRSQEVTQGNQRPQRSGTLFQKDSLDGTEG